MDPLLDHRLAHHPQHVVIAPARAQEMAGHGHPVVAGEGLDGTAGGDPAEVRQVALRRLRAGDGADQLDAPLLVPVAAQEALLLQQLQVLVRRAVGGEPETLADLPVGRGDPALLAVLLNELQDLFLPLGKVGHGASIAVRERNASGSLLPPGLDTPQRPSIHCRSAGFAALPPVPTT